MSRATEPIRELLARAVRKGRTAGAAYWVGTVGAAGRAPRRGAVGCAQCEPRAEPISETTPFDLASLTKPLATALVAVLLEQDGALDLAAPLSELLPETAGTRCGATSLLALARHAGGLPVWAPLYLEARSREEFIEAIARKPAAVGPGRTLYSDLGYILLGFALERADARPLDESFEQRVARPLGLARTAFATRGRRFDDAAATECGNAYETALAGAAGAGHAWRTGPIRGEVHDANAHALGGVAGHAGLFGPADEVAALAGEILAPRRLALGAAARRRLLEPDREGRTVGWVAAAASSAARGILPDRAPGHTGFTGTSVWLDPDSARVLVLLANRVHPAVPAVEFRPLRRAFHRLALRH